MSLYCPPACWYEPLIENGGIEDLWDLWDDTIMYGEDYCEFDSDE